MSDHIKMSNAHLNWTKNKLKKKKLEEANKRLAEEAANQAKRALEQKKLKQLSERRMTEAERKKAMKAAGN